MNKKIVGILLVAMLAVLIEDAYAQTKSTITLPTPSITLPTAIIKNFNETRVYGKVELNQSYLTRYDTLVFSHVIVNESAPLVTYANAKNRVFRYDIFDVKSQGYKTAASGILTESGAEYIVQGQSDSFAIGSLSLSSIPVYVLPPSTYRIFVWAPAFEVNSVNDPKTFRTIDVSAGATFQVH